MRELFSILKAYIPPQLKTYTKFALYCIVVLSTSYVVISTILPKSHQFFSNTSKELDDNNHFINAQIYERLGKLNEKSSTQEAILAYGLQVSSCGFLGQACSEKADNQNAITNNSGIIGRISELMVYPLTHPPASGIAWSGYILSNAGFVPKSEAYTGIGFAGLMPILPIWRAFRDLAFMILTLAIIFIGFAIIFRLKVNGKDEVKMFNALPKLVFAMIVINFSFAIAGFLIDTMYIVLAFAQAAVNGGVDYLSTTPFSQVTSPTIMGFSWGNFTTAMSAAGELEKQLYSFGEGIMITLKVIATGILIWGLTSIPSTISVMTNSPAVLLKLIPFTGEGMSDIYKLGLMTVLIGVFMTWGVKILLAIILLLALLTLMVNLLLLFLSSYIQIILSIIFAPFILLQELVPGKSAFGQWVKTIFAHLLTYPIALLLLAVAKEIQTIKGGDGTQLWMPPFLADTANISNVNGITSIIALLIIFAIPSIIRDLKKQMGVTQGLGWIGGGVIQGVAALGTAFPIMKGLSNISRSGFGSGISTLDKEGKNYKRFWRFISGEESVVNPIRKIGKVYEGKSEREIFLENIQKLQGKNDK